MKVFRQIGGLPPDARGAAVAIGKFDGVHLGHQAVIGLTRDIARRAGLPLGIVTFEPHPVEIFRPDAPPFRLMDAETRNRRFEKLGIDIVYELPFDQALAHLSPQAFCTDVLGTGLGIRHVVVGADFRFGAGRTGTTGTLAQMGETAGFTLTVAPLLQTGGIEVSSTRIRQALTDGRPEDAARMLGHLHRIEGPVLHGDKRGRLLGYPTANMSIAQLHPPRFGIYAVRVDVLDGPGAGTYGGVASIGSRPTFGENLPNLETHIFDFKGDLYGRNLSIGLVAYLRPELKFDSVDALVSQMDADSAEARRLLAR